MKRFILATSLVLLTTHAAPVWAGIADSPVPQLSGQKTSHLYSVSGVVNAGGLGTFVSCTNAASSPAIVAVEVFTDSGGAPCNAAADNAITVNPGVTVMFASQNVDSAFFATTPMFSLPTYIPLGSLRILSTQKSVLCSAWLADAYNVPSTGIASLRVVNGLKQK
jgi:hypothetical protein